METQEVRVKIELTLDIPTKVSVAKAKECIKQRLMQVFGVVKVKITGYKEEKDIYGNK